MKEKKNKKIKNITKRILELSINFISIALSLLLCTNYTAVFAHIGMENCQIKYADFSRRTGDYSVAVKYYDKIASKNESLSPYAYLALAEIYAYELNSKDYCEAFEYYKKAIELSDDIYILSSALRFVDFQCGLISNDNNQYYNKNVDFLQEGNMNFVTDIINKVNEINPDFLALPGVDLENIDDFVVDIYNQTKILISYYKWEYVSTITNNDGTLSFVEENEKVELTDTWQERVANNSPETITYYKYYRYKKVLVNETITFKELLNKTLPSAEKIYLGEVKEASRLHNANTNN